MFDLILDSVEDFHTVVERRLHRIFGGLIIHDNFGAHFQYSGHVTSPDEQRWFNTVGNYTHATLSVALSPSISIDYSGSLSASVGIDVVGDTDIRGVEFEINYIPDN